MTNTYILEDLCVDFFINLPEVIMAKERIDVLSSGSINFYIDLNPSIKQKLHEILGINLFQTDSIPMRWIKGDTSPHIDKCSTTFDKTYLAYLTNSPGELVIDGTYYDIHKGNAYVFSEGLSHETIGTCFEPRLILGPMNERGVAVGVSTTNLTDVGGKTIYIQQNNINTIEYSKDNRNWLPLQFPVTVENNDILKGVLTIKFITDISLSTNDDYFICATSHIQFGSASLNSDGTRPKIFIGGTNVTEYQGLIRNGTDSNPGYGNIYIYNLEVKTVSPVLLKPGGGWIGQEYFGFDCEIDSYIVNCSSDGDITGTTLVTGGGGIVGQCVGTRNILTNVGYVNLIGCSSSGIIDINSGGIVGSFAGNVRCTSCWSSGPIGAGGGGIFGFHAGGDGVKDEAAPGAYATNCYSTGEIRYSDDDGGAGGIFGKKAAHNFGKADAVNCYSQGNMSVGFSSTAGGIFGSDTGDDGSDFGTVIITNCYSSGNFNITNRDGIVGSYNSGTDTDLPNIFTINNTYAANGSWSDMDAKNNLIGYPSGTSRVGTDWVNGSLTPNQPYELYNMGYTPYTLTNITTTPIPKLKKTYSDTLNPGDLLSATKNSVFTILEKTGGSSSSYGTITINSNTGTISTTSTTIPGIYSLVIKNTGSYNITTTTLNVVSNVIPNAPICFPAGTPVLTDQGEIHIDKIDTKKHTIGGKEIVAITETIPLDSYLICIEKHSLHHNVPNRRTIISKDHKIMYRGKLISSECLIEFIPTCHKISYNKEKLYNVLLKDYSVMSINNLIVETLNPNNFLAKIYSENYTIKQKNNFINILNNKIKHDKKNMLISKNIQML